MGDKKPLRIRFRDFIVRIVIIISKLISCNKITLKSSCCDKIDNHVETNVTYNSPHISPEVNTRHVEDITLEPIKEE